MKYPNKFLRGNSFCVPCRVKLINFVAQKEIRVFLLVGLDMTNLNSNRFSYVSNSATCKIFVDQILHAVFRVFKGFIPLGARMQLWPRLPLYDACLGYIKERGSIH